MIIDGPTIASLTARLSEVDERRVARYPGGLGGRQPVHTCYVPASKVGPTTPRDWGEQALAAMDEHGFDLSEDLTGRVKAKLAREPVEDLRIDFEDGYGAPVSEDDDARYAAGCLVRWHAEGIAPFTSGLRIKSFDTPGLRDRGIRTLDIFLETLGDPPPGFVITFPKVTAAEQVEVFAELLAVFEQRLGRPDGSLKFEIQVETTQSIVDSDGRLAIPRFIAAGGPRVTGLHFGTYDYTAACGLGAGQQHLGHHACDFARHVMQVSAAGTGIRLSDGSSNVLPVGETPAVLAAWRVHYGLVRRSLEHGFFQGWDMHPAQLVTRYAAVFGYYRESLAGDARRLAAYATRAESGLLDEPATAQALSASLLRSVDCGAATAEEITQATGLHLDVLRAFYERAIQ
ncbi:citrate lyase beta subunit [Kibdelosporangium banguiense]|uniref:Citrate lyase beta subunit n=1 Tax=Kibdelosporangium banguiense TaxID=1365924 RepID=A0ABS4TH23_9PSEU|nr:aldolase/citrate lyase family protein [Kibdelosporangium banguiense]MBP2323733.1 citrate lyase beta subunit [Kibdelosporangium banguiense]